MDVVTSSSSPTDPSALPTSGLPGLTLPPGWTVRPVQLVGDDGGRDVDLALDVCLRCETAAVGDAEVTRGEVLELLVSPVASLPDTRLVLDPEGRAAGYLAVELDDAARDGFLDAYVDPGHPGVPAELWRALLESGVAAVAARAAARGTSYTAKAGAYATDGYYTQALLDAGFVPVRHFFRMGIDTTDPAVPLTAPPLPDGTTIEVARSEAQRRELHDVFEASFVDHWDHHDRDADAWLAIMDALDGHDPDRWWLVRVDGEPAALCILDDSRLEFGDGYVRTLGVREDFRGRGLARWLLQRAFVEYRDLGRGRVMLMVDSDSPTGARALYESVGMHPVTTVVAHHRAVEPSG